MCGKPKTDWISWVREYASERGGECLTDEASTVNDRVCLRCKCGNKWNTQIKTLKYSNTWCPICSRAKDQPREGRICGCCGVSFTDDSVFNNKTFCSVYCQQKQWTIENRDRVDSQRKEYHKANRDKIIARVNKWQAENKDAVKKHRKKYKASHKLSTSERIKHNLRCRIIDVLNGRIKVGSAIQDLGCTGEELKKHLESMWQEGMSWDNYGREGWHIDHIKPLAAFDLEDPEQFKQACHYTNLQPLWAEENLKKRDKWED